MKGIAIYFSKLFILVGCGIGGNKPPYQAVPNDFASYTKSIKRNYFKGLDDTTVYYFLNDSSDEKAIVFKEEPGLKFGNQWLSMKFTMDCKFCKDLMTVSNDTLYHLVPIFTDEASIADNKPFRYEKEVFLVMNSKAGIKRKLRLFSLEGMYSIAFADVTVPLGRTDSIYCYMTHLENAPPRSKQFTGLWFTKEKGLITFSYFDGAFSRGYCRVAKK
jgi:hypothetical protein